jgi:hypothetical protein
MAKKTKGVVAYVITPLGKKQFADVTGHGRSIMKVLRRLRKATGAEILAAVSREFKTEKAQSKRKNVAGVYLWRFTRKGLLKQVAA